MRLIDKGNKYILEIVDGVTSKYEILEILRCFMRENDMLLFAHMNISAEDIINTSKEVKKKYYLSDEILIIDEPKIRMDILQNEKFVNDRKVFVNSESSNPQRCLPKRKGILTTWFKCRNEAEELNEVGKTNFCCIVIENGKDYERYAYKISDIEIDEGRAFSIEINRSSIQIKDIYIGLCMKFKNVEILYH